MIVSPPNEPKRWSSEPARCVGWLGASVTAQAPLHCTCSEPQLVSKGLADVQEKQLIY